MTPKLQREHEDSCGTHRGTVAGEAPLQERRHPYYSSNFVGTRQQVPHPGGKSAVNCSYSCTGVKMRCTTWLLLSGALIGSLPLAHAQAPPLHLASLEWLPYVGRSLPDGGLS